MPTMHDPGPRIAAALDRLRELTAQRPEFGRGTVNTSVCELGDVTQVVAREKAFMIESDLGQPPGGGGTAPSPTMLVRAALGACLAMGYRLRAAEAGVVLDAVRVTVESESDVRGLLDPDGCVAPGFSALRYHVEIDSPADPRELERVVELGDRMSPVLDLLGRTNAITRTVAFGPLPLGAEA